MKKASNRKITAIMMYPTKPPDSFSSCNLRWVTAYTFKLRNITLKSNLS